MQPFELALEVELIPAVPAFDDAAGAPLFLGKFPLIHFRLRLEARHSSLEIKGARPQLLLFPLFFAAACVAAISAFMAVLRSSSSNLKAFFPLW